MSDTLVLNADGLPVSYLPLSTIDWQEAIKYMVLDKADVLSWHDNWIVRSARWETPVPSVIMLRDYMKPKMLSASVAAMCTYATKELANTAVQE